MIPKCQRLRLFRSPGVTSSSSTHFILEAGAAGGRQVSKHSSQTIKKHANMVDDEPVIEEIDTGEMEEEEEEQAQPVQPESVGFSAVPGEVVTLCKIISTAIASYLSNSLLFVQLLPPNQGPDKLSVLLSVILQLAGAAQFCYAYWVHGFTFTILFFLVAGVLPFTQDIKLKIPGFSTSASAFIPSIALLGMVMPHDVCFFALVYFTLMSIGGLAPSLSQAKEDKKGLPKVNILNHPLLPYQLALVPLFRVGTTLVDMAVLSDLNQEEILELSKLLSAFAAVALLGLYIGVSIYSLVFSLRNPAYNGGKWTPFRAGLGKVIQEMILTVLNMNLVYWAFYLLGKYLEFKEFMEEITAPLDPSASNATTSSEEKVEL